MLAVSGFEEAGSESHIAGSRRDGLHQFSNLSWIMLPVSIKVNDNLCTVRGGVRCAGLKRCALSKIDHVPQIVHRLRSYIRVLRDGRSIVNYDDRIAIRNELSNRLSENGALVVRGDDDKYVMIWRQENTSAFEEAGVMPLELDGLSSSEE